MDSIKYFARGGRLNVTVARVGNLLNIKPVILIEKGEAKVVAKKIGLNKTVSEICELVGKDEIDFNEPVVSLSALRTSALRRRRNRAKNRIEINKKRERAFRLAKRAFFALQYPKRCNVIRT